MTRSFFALLWVFGSLGFGILGIGHVGVLSLVLFWLWDLRVFLLGSLLVYSSLAFCRTRSLSTMAHNLAFVLFGLRP
jgi:hypothetical protein